MNCPICNQSLDQAKYQYLPYHYCKKCEGMWVDTRLLKNLATRLAADTNIKPDKPVPFLHKTIVQVPQAERIRLCPQCTAGMKKLNYAYDSNIIIDRCDACEGVWLDEGEIIKLAQFHQLDEDSILASRALMGIYNLPKKMEKQAEKIINVFLTLMWLFP